MVTKNGFLFGVGVFVICVAMLLFGRLSDAFAEDGIDPADILTMQDATLLVSGRR